METNTNRPAALAELGEYAALLRNFENDRKEIARRRAELEAKLSLKTLAKNQDAVRAIAAVRAEEEITINTHRQSEAAMRDLAIKCVPYAYELERQIHSAITTNKRTIAAGIERRVGKFYTPEWLRFMVTYSEAYITEAQIEPTVPVNLGGADEAELHPDVKAQDVLETIIRLEAKLSDAKNRGQALAKQFA